MVHKHKKLNFSKKNNNKNKKCRERELRPSKNKTQKRSYSDNEITSICRSGHFTKISDEGLYNETNIKKFDKMTQKLNRIKKYKKLKIPALEYTQFLMDTFDKHNNSKKEATLSQDGTII